MKSTNVRRFGFVNDERTGAITSWTIDNTNFDKPPVTSGPSYVLSQRTWLEDADLLWISRERHPTTYGPITAVFSHPFLIVVPSSPKSPLSLYWHLANIIQRSWYTYFRGGTQIVRDIDLLDGLAAKYNLIVLGGPNHNFYTFRRTQEEDFQMLKFTESGGVEINSHKYDEAGTGVLFLSPSPIKTRLTLFISGTDEQGLKRAAWSIPFRYGLQSADYIVFGENYGDPYTGWTAGADESIGMGGILAAGYWNNTWNYDSSSGYLK